MYNLIRQGLPTPNMLSRLYLYWYARYYCGLDFNQNYSAVDSGSTISDGILGLVEKGVCLESSWPYYDKVSGFPTQFEAQPSSSLDAEAATCKLFISALQVGLNRNLYTASIGLTPYFSNSSYNADAPAYAVAPSANVIKGLLASGVPVVCGVSLYLSSFYYAGGTGYTDQNGGVIPCPPYGMWNVQTSGGEITNFSPGGSQANDQYYGGHALVFVGYNDAMTSPFTSPSDGKMTAGYFLMRNSWGAGRGLTSPLEHSGYFWLPYEFLTLSDGNSGTLVNECWAIGSAGSLSGDSVAFPGPLVISSDQTLSSKLFTKGVQIKGSTLTIGSADAL